MKKLLLAVIAVAVLAIGPARAADMGVPAYKAAPIPPPAPSWAGFYVGGNLGGGVASGEFLDPCFTCADIKINDPAFTAGGQIGYNWQWRAMVYGLEGDFNWLSANRTLTFAADDSCCVGTATFKMDSFATIRGRMGLAYDNALAYVTAGVAWGHFNSDVALCTQPACTSGGNNLTSTDNTWLPGIAAGAGVEFMVTNNVTVRGEFLYMMFKDDNTNYIFRATGQPVGCPNSGSPTSCGINYTNSAAIARLGVNWKFN